jgi:ATP phosphoribosyltransferase
LFTFAAQRIRLISHDSNLRIAIQKSGRLSEDSLSLIKECGIQFSTAARASSNPSRPTSRPNYSFLRDDDIPGYVADGVADVALWGKTCWWKKTSP